MSGRDPESAEFAPTRLGGGPGRRVDPLVVGVVMVVLGIGLAIAKPWEPRPAAGEPVAVASLPAASAPISSASPAGPEAVTPEAPTEGGAAASTVLGTPSITWPEVAPFLRDHPAWGARAIVRDPEPDRGAGADLVERWAGLDAAPEDGPLLLPTADQGVLALGLTFPTDDVPLDVRVWRPLADGTWEWLDAVPLGTTLADGALLFAPPRIGAAALPTWPTGAYRLEVLTAFGVRRVDVALPDRFEVVPPPPERLVTATQRRLPSPFDPDLGDIAGGRPFAVIDGRVTVLPGGPAAPLDVREAWLGVVAAGPQVAGPVPSIYEPLANGLGVTLPAGAGEVSGTIVRVDPDESALPGARRAVGIHFGADARLPYLVFRAPASATWAPGTYRMDVRWSLDGTRHEAAYHAELRPGPDVVPGGLLAATRALAPLADTGGAAAVSGPSLTAVGLSCDARSPQIASGEAMAIGIGLATSGSTPPQVEAVRLLEGGRTQAVPLVVAAEVVPGLLVVGPADASSFRRGVYRLQVDTGGSVQALTVCLGASLPG